MFGLGIGEIFLILVFALIFIGPKKLPELAKNLGKSLREFQKAKDDLIAQVHTESHDTQEYQQVDTPEDAQGDHHSALTNDTFHEDDAFGEDHIFHGGDMFHEDAVTADTMDIKAEPSQDLEELKDLKKEGPEEGTKDDTKTDKNT